MNRREFGSVLLGGMAASMLPPRHGRSSDVRVNGARIQAHLTALAEFGRNPQGGVSRVAYSDFDKQARAVVIDWMRAAKLDPHIDFAGNIIGRRAGADPRLKPLLFGSHIDSVPGGGNYDGDVGTLSAIEIAQTFAEQGITTRHPLEVVCWQNEEGGLIGSRAVGGQLEASELRNTTNSGRTIEQGIAFIGGDPSKLDQVRRRRGDIACYLELHIEQGGTLEQTKTNIGVVEGIVGIKQWDVTVTGVQNHAGTTAMADRHDALLAAARYVDMVNRVVRSAPGRQVGTVGRIQPFPGATNVIPGRVVASLELRDLDQSKIGMLFRRIQDEAKQIGAQNGTTFEFTEIHVNVPAPSDPRVRAIVADAAK
jgi:N-carbamoyl-L-amino-acid hydrolase